MQGWGHRGRVVDGQGRRLHIAADPERTLSLPSSPRSSTATLGHSSTATLGRSSPSRSRSPILPPNRPNPFTIPHEAVESCERSTADLSSATSFAAAAPVSLSRFAVSVPFREPPLPTHDALSVRPSRIATTKPQQRRHWQYSVGRHEVDGATIRHPLRLRRKNEATAWAESTAGVEHVYRVYRPTGQLLGKEVGELLKRWRYCVAGLPVQPCKNAVEARVGLGRLVALGRAQGYEMPASKKDVRRAAIISAVQAWRAKVRMQLGVIDAVEEDIAEAERKVLGKTALFPVAEAPEPEPEPGQSGEGKGKKRKASKRSEASAPAARRARVGELTPPPSSSSSATTVGLVPMPLTPTPPLAETGEYQMVTRSRVTRRAVVASRSRHGDA